MRPVFRQQQKSLGSVGTSVQCQEQKSVRRQSSDNRVKEFTDTGG